MNNLYWLEIYPEYIDRCLETCEEVLKQYNCDIEFIDDFHELAFENLKQIGTFDNITNSIMDAYYMTLQDTLKRIKPELETEYYVNGSDTQFIINGEEV